MPTPSWFALGVMVGTLIHPGVQIAYRIAQHLPIISQGERTP